MQDIYEKKTGQAQIKPEFRKERWFEDGEEGEESHGVFGDDVEEGKKFSRDKPNRRGQNKGQRGKKRILDAVRICKYTAIGEDCPLGEKCKYDHNLEEYLATKPADLGDKCVYFDLYGKCIRGYKCRFLGAHLDENKKLVENEELVKNHPTYVTNGIEVETQVQLDRHKYKFPKTEKYMEWVAKEIKAEEDMNAMNAMHRKRKLEEQAMAENDAEAVEAPSTAEQEGVAKKVKTDEIEMENPVVEPLLQTPAEEAKPVDHDLPKIDMNIEAEKPLGPIDTERPYKKLIDFRNKTYLAPLTTVGNLPFRRICKEYGVDITCGEMAMAKNLLQGQQSEWALTKRHASEDIFGMQICGSKIDQVVKACELINNETDVDFVDLNMGCPIDLVFKAGAGSALPESKGKMVKIIKGMQTVLDVPVTVKFRTGLKENMPTAHKLIPRFEELNVALCTIHGRSRMQRYTKSANWDYIGSLKREFTQIPLFGNGDVLSFEDYNNCKAQSGVDGIMIGRGALIKPWIFDEIKEQRHWDISSRERLDMLKRFCNYGLEHWGTDSQGVNNTRRFLCEWQSFLYRYVPVGVMEVVPQKLNERAPPYFGRDDLETLMASPKAADWVKLSEMLLGPAPEDFTFVPKHKANSFEG